MATASVTRQRLSFFLLSPWHSLPLTLIDLGLLPGTTEALSLRINDKGDSIGIAIADQDKGVLFHNKKVIDVAPIAVASSVSDINAVSQVAGYMWWADRRRR